MIIYVNNSEVESKLLKDAFFVSTDEWDDYSTKCQFSVFYFSKDQVQHEIGDIKILRINQKNQIARRTVLEDSFEKLDEAYISLGQSLDFYERLLKACGKKRAITFLEIIRDISWQPKLAEPFETFSSFRNALLRFNSAQRARRLGSSVINGEDINEDFTFTYSCKIHGAENEISVDFDFDSDDPLPRRIVGIIGRNASGKTRFLSQLTEDLVKIRRSSLKTEREREESFTPVRPIFTRLLTISFSAFDRFARPQSEQMSYVYCGIRSSKGTLSRRGLEERFQTNLTRINESGRSYDWAEYMQEILGETGRNISFHVLTDFAKSDSKEDSLELLSSGQAILVHAITSLLAWIEPESMILFDEPETHLHPNAVASLFNVYNKILAEYDSYSIIATHSPIVIQEIPGKRVILFEREGNNSTSRNIDIETFGENISELTRHVFDTIEIPSFYKMKLNNLSQKYGFEEILELFDNNLSMSAQSFLMTLYMDRDNEDA